MNYGGLRYTGRSAESFVLGVGRPDCQPTRLTILVSASARRVRGLEIVDALGTRTICHRYNGKISPVKVIDKFGHVLEEYYYKDYELTEAVITNIKNGEKIKLRMGGYYDDKSKMDMKRIEIHIGHEIGFRDYAVIGDKVLISHTDIYSVDNQGDGIGLTVANWIMRYEAITNQIKEVYNIGSRNPLIISLMRRIIIPESLIYYRAVQPSNNDLLIFKMISPTPKTIDELVKSLGSFMIGDEKDRFFGKESISYAVVIANGTVSYSEWAGLPAGVLSKDIEILDDWRVEFRGNIVGQVKALNDFIMLEGRINPIGIFKDEQGRIVQYQNGKII